MTQWRCPDLLSSCYAAFSKLLKRLVKVERPAATCEALGLCGDLGKLLKAAIDDGQAHHDQTCRRQQG